MTNQLNTNFSLIYDKIKFMKKNKIKVPITDNEIMQLIKNNKIDYELYQTICVAKLENYPINYFLTTTNGFNIADGLYEQGSKQIYTDKNKNVFDTTNFKFSEHYGYLLFDADMLDKVVIINKSRIDPRDPTIYFPKNVKSIGKYNYIFHTHPITPFIGSRAFSNGIIYDSPSINDVLHFIEYHNYGKLLCSLVLAAEGLYVIRKNNFNNDIIKLDDMVFTDDFDDVMNECDDYAHNMYADYIKNERIADEIFHTIIAMDFNYINLINKVLMKYDIYIDYYPRVRIKNIEKGESDTWVIPNIYLPNVIY